MLSKISLVSTIVAALVGVLFGVIGKAELDEQQKTDLIGEVKSLRVEKDSLRSKIEERERVLSGLLAEESKINSNVKFLNAEVEDKKTLLDEKQQVLDSVNTNIQLKNKEISGRERKTNDARDTLNILNQKIVGAETVFRRKTDDVLKLDRDIAALTQKSRNLNLELKPLLREKERLVKELKETQGLLEKERIKTNKVH